MNDMTRVIAAISTPPGKGGVAVIRMSGDGALDIASKAFLPRSGKKISDYPPRYQIYGDLMDGGEAVDDVLLTYFRAPSSYTGEDTVEISCHGGTLVTRTVLEALFTLGAVPAEAGEFTKRAFINGRLSLTDAESIGNLLEAKDRTGLRLHSGAARERLNSKIAELRGELTDLLSSAFARIDYPDEDLGDFDDEEFMLRLKKIESGVSTLKDTYRVGRAISDGIDTVICGKPNVGKSSFYNLIVGEEAAIVTEIEGTTRDVLQRTVSLGGVTLRLADTAGIRKREGIDRVEQIGIDRSLQSIEKCELLFALFDLSRPFDREDEEIIKAISESNAVKIAILNKSDLETSFDPARLEGLFTHTLVFSAKCSPEENLGEVANTVNRIFYEGKISISDDAIISSARQHAELTRAHLHLTDAVCALRDGFSQDAVSFDVEQALGAISELDGRRVNEEVVDDIFSKFCVGK